MGDCKSLQGWSNLFRRRISNPPERLTVFTHAPCKGKSFKIRSKFKAFALTGRQVSVYNTQGDALG